MRARRAPLSYDRRAQPHGTPDDLPSQPEPDGITEPARSIGSSARTLVEHCLPDPGRTPAEGSNCPATADRQPYSGARG